MTGLVMAVGIRARLFGQERGLQGCPTANEPETG